jgi:hypothetical protein
LFQVVVTGTMTTLETPRRPRWWTKPPPASAAQLLDDDSLNPLAATDVA